LSVCEFGSHSASPWYPKKKLLIINSVLSVVRSVATVGNYDYTIDYTFYLDGTIEVKVRASGYIFGAYHQLEAMRKDLHRKRDFPSYDYGYQVHDVVATSMHDHGLNFKADLDIAGTANTLYRVDIAPYHHQYPWDSAQRSTMHLMHSPVEKESGLDWPYNSGALYVVLNNDSTNAWGEKRGTNFVFLSTFDPQSDQHHRISYYTGYGNGKYVTAAMMK
jgi:primary-amine oxidase